MPDTVLIISARANELNDQLILGSPGWIMPEEREETDWLVFIRFMGWRSLLLDPLHYTNEIVEKENVKWIIICGNPDELAEERLNYILNSIQDKRILCITQAGSKDGNFSNFCNSYTTDVLISGSQLSWNGIENKKSMSCRTVINLSRLNTGTDSEIFATLDDITIISVAEYGKCKLAALSFTASEVRDQSGYFTLLLKELIIRECMQPVVWYDWENCLILRMDDPGSLEVIYNESYNTSKLSEADWEIIGNELEQNNARMSLGYVSGWVDDANEDRGNLMIRHKAVDRVKGKVYASPEVRYEKKTGHNEKRIYDFTAEYSGIQKLRNKGLAEIEVHGFTHLHPDRMLWAEAADRYTNVSWYREFGAEKINYLEQHPEHEHPLTSGLETIRNFFATDCSTLICPGDEFTNDVLGKVLQTQLIMVSSYYLAIRINHQLCWAQHICAPYLDTAESKWFDSHLPVVGYFHDFDISINGIEWFTKNLDAWKKAGAKNIIDFRQAAGKLSHLLSAELHDGKLEVATKKIANFKYVKPEIVKGFIPGSNYVEEVEVDN